MIKAEDWVTYAAPGFYSGRGYAVAESKAGLRFADCRTVAGKGRWLQQHNRGNSGEPFWLTGVWHELSEFDPVDAVAYAEELLRRAKARLAQHQSEMLRSWGVGNKGPK